jgi:two-component system response regulator AtoC
MGPVIGLDDSIMKRLRAYSWPGNVRELENVVERALILCGTGPLKADYFPIDAHAAPFSQTTVSPDPISIGPLVPAVEAFEATLIKLALNEAGESKPRAAALLDISERTLWYKLKKYWPKENA